MMQNNNDATKIDVNKLTIINTNARSLCPKINFLVDCFGEMDAGIGWLADGSSLNEDVEDLAKGAGLGFLYRNRPFTERGLSHGGVAIVYKRSDFTFRNYEFENEENYEIVAAVDSMPGHSRKMIIVACYLPPGYSVGRGRGALHFMEDLLMEMKQKYSDPFILVGGDFCLLYTSPSPRDRQKSRMPSSA